MPNVDVIIIYKCRECESEMSIGCETMDINVFEMFVHNRTGYVEYSYDEVTIKDRYLVRHHGQICHECREESDNE